MDTASHSYITQLSGWWFQARLLFSIIYGIILAIDFHIFFRGVETTNQVIQPSYVHQLSYQKQGPHLVPRRSRVPCKPPRGSPKKAARGSHRDPVPPVMFVDLYTHSLIYWFPQLCYCKYADLYTTKTNFTGCLVPPVIQNRHKLSPEISEFEAAETYQLGSNTAIFHSFWVILGHLGSALGSAHHGNWLPGCYIRSSHTSFPKWSLTQFQGVMGRRGWMKQCPRMNAGKPM